MGSVSQNTIVLFKGSSVYQVLNAWVDELSTCFNELGVQTFVIDLEDQATIKEKLNQAFENPYFAYIGLNGMGSELQEKYQAYDSVKVPFIGVMVDNPIHNLDRLSIQSDYVFFSYPDPYHLEYAKALFPGVNLFFLPHAGSLCDGAQGKKYDLVFLGSYKDPDEIEKSWNRFSPSIQCWLKDLKKKYFEKPTANYLELLPRFWDDRLYLSDHLENKVSYFLSEIDLYIRYFSRKKVLEALDQQGVSVDLFGKGWDSLKSTRHRAQGSVDYQKGLSVMASAKGVLNVSPNFYSGSHERVFSALLNGAVLITDKRDFFDPQIKNSKRVITYSLDDLNDLSEKIQNAFDDEDKDAIHQAKDICMNKHAWKCRAKKLLHWIERFQGLSMI